MLRTPIPLATVAEEAACVFWPTVEPVRLGTARAPLDCRAAGVGLVWTDLMATGLAVGLKPFHTDNK